MNTSWIKKLLVTAVGAGALFIGAAAATPGTASAHEHYHFLRGYRGEAPQHYHRGGGPGFYNHGYQGPRPIGYFPRADRRHTGVVIAR